MSANKIRVNTDSLNQTKKNLQEKLNSIRKAISDISEDMNTLNSMWMGEAHDAFVANTDSGIQFLNNVCDGIQGIINYEENAVTEYNKCEQQVAELIRQMQI